MTLAQLNAKIDRVFVHDSHTSSMHHREELRHLRDTRLGLLGVHASMEPSEEQVQIVHDELFPPADQKELL